MKAPTEHLIELAPQVVTLQSESMGGACVCVCGWVGERERERVRVCGESCVTRIVSILIILPKFTQYTLMYRFS